MRLRVPPVRRITAPQYAQSAESSPAMAPHDPQRKTRASTPGSASFLTIVPQRQGNSAASTEVTSYWVSHDGQSTRRMILEDRLPRMLS
jgi:hypothetical protein